MYNPLRRGDLGRFSNIVAWLAAGGIALWWQQRSQAAKNVKTFSAAETDAWNAEKKKKEPGTDGNTATAPPTTK